MTEQKPFALTWCERDPGGQWLLIKEVFPSEAHAMAFARQKAADIAKQWVTR